MRVLAINELQRDLTMAMCPELRPDRFHLVAGTSSASPPTCRPFRASKVYMPYFEFPPTKVGDGAAAKEFMGSMPPGSVRPLGSAHRPGTEAIYITRRSVRSKIRGVANEAQVLAELRRSFPALRVLDPAGRKWRALRHEFENASVIIGPHGGGLSNMIFAPVNTTIVEIGPLRSIRRGDLSVEERPCYLGLAHGLGFAYHEISAQPFDYDSAAPMVVPLPAVRAVAAEILARRREANERAARARRARWRIARRRERLRHFVRTAAVCSALLLVLLACGGGQQRWHVCSACRQPPAPRGLSKV